MFILGNKLWASVRVKYCSVTEFSSNTYICVLAVVSGRNKTRYYQERNILAKNVISFLERPVLSLIILIAVKHFARMNIPICPRYNPVCDNRNQKKKRTILLYFHIHSLWNNQYTKRSILRK